MDTHFENIAYTDISVQRARRSNPITQQKTRGRMYRMIILGTMILITIALTITWFVITANMKRVKNEYASLSYSLEGLLRDRNNLQEAVYMTEMSHKALFSDKVKVEVDAKAIENKMMEIKKENDDLQEQLERFQKTNDEMTSKLERLKLQNEYFRNEIDKQRNKS